MSKLTYSLLPDHIKETLMLSDKQRFYLGLSTCWYPAYDKHRKLRAARRAAGNQ